MSRGEFLCGCTPEAKRNYIFSESGGRKDAEGFSVCPEHGARMYGWNSPMKQHDAGQEVIDFSMVGGEGKLTIKPGIQDRRDNRDPIEDHDEILSDWRKEKAAQNGKGN